MTSDANTPVRRALIIEDEELVRSALCDMLELENVPWLAAADADTGVALLQEHRPTIAVVILDLTMPGLSGVAAYDALREKAPDVPIVLSSGSDAWAASAPFGDRPIAHYLQKPYPLADLVAVVRRFVGPAAG